MKHLQGAECLQESRAHLQLDYRAAYEYAAPND